MCAKKWLKQFFPENFFSSWITDFRFLGKFPLTIFLFLAFLGIGSLVFSDFWHNYAKWQYPKCDGARFLKKKILANLGQKLPKNRVFWTLCQIGSLVFSDFWLKRWSAMCCKNGFSFFGEIPFYQFPVTSFSFLSTSFQAAHCIFLLSGNFSIFIWLLSSGRSVQYVACFFLNRFK